MKTSALKRALSAQKRPERFLERRNYKYGFRHRLSYRIRQRMHESLWLRFQPQAGQRLRSNVQELYNIHQ